MLDEKKFVEILGKETGLDAGPAQNRFELRQTIRFIEAYMSPKVIIEIGTARGGTLKFWNALIPEDGLVISLDLNDRGFTPKIQAYYKEDKRMNFIIGDSLAQVSVVEVEQILGSRKVDILFIDGNHEYEYVSNDYKNYSQFVREDGFIIFHDIITKNYGPRLKFDEMKVNKKFCKGYIEIFGIHNPCGMGILINK